MHVECHKPLDFRRQILHAFTKSVSTMWIVCTPLIGIGFLLCKSTRNPSFLPWLRILSGVVFFLALMIKEYTLASNVKRTGPADPEASTDRPNSEDVSSAKDRDDLEAQTVVSSTIPNPERATEDEKNEKVEH